MLANLILARPVAVAGALGVLVAAAPVIPAVTSLHHPSTTIHAAAFKDDPAGGGCDANGNCGWGGQNAGPGGGAGGHGCVVGVGCGFGGQFAGPDGVPGGTACLSGVGCGSGHA